MITRFRLLTACVSVFLHSAALAGPINFGNNPIMFTNPSVVHGNGATAMIVPNVPQLVKLANGLSVVNFSYTATITALAPGSKFGLVYIDWNATRMGTLAMNSDLVLTTSGNTTITFTGGDVDFRISGALDSGGPQGSRWRPPLQFIHQCPRQEPAHQVEQRIECLGGRASRDAYAETHLRGSLGWCGRWRQAHPILRI